MPVSRWISAFHPLVADGPHERTRAVGVPIGRARVTTPGARGSLRPSASHPLALLPPTGAPRSCEVGPGRASIVR